MIATPQPGPSRGALGLAVPLALFVVLDLLLAVFVVRSFEGPLLLPWDPGHYLFVVRYFSENIHWWPIPQLDLDTNWTAYPQGTNHVFLHWSFERDVLCSLLTRTFGFGPWFQLYFLASVLVSAVGCYVLCRRDLGDAYALLVALAASFGNFAVIREFPLHLPYACVHWSVLGIVADFLLARRYWLGCAWSVRFVLVRVVVLLLTLGLDPGYVAGFSLSSFTLTIGWIALDQVARKRGRPAALWRGAADAWCRAWRTRAPGRTLLPLLAIAVAAAWLYVPLAFQVARAASRYDFSGLENLYLWVEPARVLVPFVWPFRGKTMALLFADRPENAGFDLRPGGTFVLLAALGLAIGARRRGFMLPAVVLVLAGVFFHPVDLPTLKVWPWFAMARVPARVTFVLPVVFALIVSSVPLAWWRRRVGTVVAVVLVTLFATETSTVYGGLVRYRRQHPGTPPSTTLLDAMRVIREAPGDAVLEWPMAAVPSTLKLGVFHSKLAGAFQLSYFHRKKVLGFYFGRGHPEIWQPLLDVGWSDLIFPNTPNAYESTRQRRDFTADEWRFMEAFFSRNDFAGVLLYADLLPPETLAGFHSRFGAPVAGADTYPPLGRIEFIPKRAEWRDMVDPEEGRGIRFEKAAPVLERGQRIDLGSSASDDYLFAGWGMPATVPRWTTAHEAMIGFSASPGTAARFRARVGGFGPQHVTVRWNGTVVGAFDPPMHEWDEVEIAVPATLVTADNRVTLEVSDPLPRRAEDGVRHLGIRVDWFEID